MRYFKIFILVLFFSMNVFSKNCADDSYFLRAQQLYKSKQHLLSAVHFSHIALSGCTTQLKERSQLYYAFNMIELGENTEALSALNILVENQDPNIKKTALIGLGFLGLQTIKDSDVQSRFKIWNERFDKETLKTTQQLSQQTNKPDLFRLHNDLINSSTKSLALAGISSALLPGLGQFYVGAYQSAAVSFVLNALLLSSTIELHKEGLKMTALTSGALWSVVYLGNILNAVKSAKKYNGSRREDLDSNFKYKLFPELPL